MSQFAYMQAWCIFHLHPEVLQSPWEPNAGWLPMDFDASWVASVQLKVPNDP